MEQVIGSGAKAIKDTNMQTFMADVIEASQEVPVIVDFWAPWCGPCKQLGPMLERLVLATKGAVRMVKVNVDENQQIAQQMQIQSIPAVYAFVDGRPVDAFVGAKPEGEIKAFIQRLASLKKGGPAAAIEEALVAAREAMTAGDIGTAENIYRQVVQRFPDNVPALVGLARCALAAGDVEDAKQIAATLLDTEAKNQDVISLKAAIDLAEEAAKSAGALGEWQQRLAANANDHEARLEYAKALFALGKRPEAIDELLGLIKTDREWNEQAARKQLLQLFEAMGFADPLTIAARKRLSSILFS